MPEPSVARPLTMFFETSTNVTGSGDGRAIYYEEKSMKPEPKTAEEWARECQNSRHWFGTFPHGLATLGNETGVMCLNCVASYARQELEAERERIAEYIRNYPTTGREHPPRGHGFCEDFGCSDFDRLADGILALGPVEVP